MAKKIAYEISHRKRELFLETLRATGQITVAARRAGYVDANFMRKLAREDPEFAKEWDDAIECAADTLQDAGFDRAVNGVQKGVYYKGDLVDVEVQHSDRLLMFLLKGLRRDVFGDQQKIETNVNVGIAVVPATAVSAEEWERRAVAMHGAQEIIDAQFTEVRPPAPAEPKLVRS